MDSIKDVLKGFKPTEDKYISREFQSFAVYLSQKLNDEDHKSLYMRLAKTMPRPVLEEALRYVVDSRIDRKGALFMWKLKEMGVWGGKKNSPPRKAEGETGKNSKLSTFAKATADKQNSKDDSQLKISESPKGKA